MTTDLLTNFGLPPSIAIIKSTTHKKQKPFEPPMNTDAHRLKADKEKQLLKKNLSGYRRGSAKFFSRTKAGTTDSTDERRPNTHGPATKALACKAAPQNWQVTRIFNLCESVKSVDPRPFLRHLRRLRLNDFRLRMADNRENLFIFILSLSVFIAVHRWLNIFIFNLLNQNLSACSFMGACDDPVS